MNRTRSSATAKKLATKAWSRLVRARGRCELCGSVESLNAAHIVTRQMAATRTLLANGICLCAKCHFRFTHWPVDFVDWLTRIGVVPFIPIINGDTSHYMHLTMVANTYAARPKKHVILDWNAELDRLLILETCDLPRHIGGYAAEHSINWKQHMREGLL